jgi:hypothetical protein
MESKELKFGFSEIDYKWDSNIRVSIIPSFLFYYFSIFLTDSPSSTILAYIPMYSFYVYIVYFIIYSAYLSSVKKKYKLNKVDQIRIPIILKIITIILISLISIDVFLWSFIS